MHIYYILGNIQKTYSFPKSSANLKKKIKCLWILYYSIKAIISFINTYIGSFGTHINNKQIIELPVVFKPHIVINILVIWMKFSDNLFVITVYLWTKNRWNLWMNKCFFHNNVVVFKCELNELNRVRSCLSKKYS